MKRVNYRKLVATVAVIISLTVSIYLWSAAVQWDNRVEQDEESWYQHPEVSRLEVMLRYDIAFKEIILLNALILGSVYLILKATKQKQE